MSLTGMSLIGTSLTGTSLTGTSLIGMSLSAMSLIGTSLTGMSLIGTSLTGTSLTGTSLIGAPWMPSASSGSRSERRRPAWIVVQLIGGPASDRAPGRAVDVQLGEGHVAERVGDRRDRPSGLFERSRSASVRSSMPAAASAQCDQLRGCRAATRSAPDGSASDGGGGRATGPGPSRRARGAASSRAGRRRAARRVVVSPTSLIGMSLTGECCSWMSLIGTSLTGATARVDDVAVRNAVGGTPSSGT